MPAPLRPAHNHVHVRPLRLFLVAPKGARRATKGNILTEGPLGPFVGLVYAQDSLLPLSSQTNPSHPVTRALHTCVCC